MSKVAATVSVLEAVKSGLGSWLCAVEGGSIKVHGHKVHGLRMSWLGAIHSQLMSVLDAVKSGLGSWSFFQLIIPFLVCSFLLLLGSFRFAVPFFLPFLLGATRERSKERQTAESWEQVIGKEEDGQATAVGKGKGKEEEKKRSRCV